ncbi:putative ribonuclease H-like domain-containing protein [Tanacetum coccineum]
MMGIPNEHQLKFNSIKDAKLLLEAIEKMFGGNAATKKTQRNILKQQYENFTAPSSETLDQTFDRLQKLVKWNTHAIVWRNKPKLETMSMNDLYNNLKVYEPEVKGTSRSNTSTQNMAFVSSNNSGSTNEAVNTAHEVFTISTQDLQQLHLHDLEEMDLRCQMAMLTMRARRVLQLPQGGHFARECRASRNQDNMNKESSRRSVPVETTTSNALVSCDGLGEYDWSDQADEGPTIYPLMTYSSSSSDSEVSNDSTCSKSCLETVEVLKYQNEQLLKRFEKSELMIIAYKTSLQSIEERLEFYKKNESIYVEKINGLKWDIQIGEITIGEHMKKLEIVQKEKYGIQFNLDKFENASKSLNKIIESQIIDNCKKGLGYNAVPPPLTGNFMPLKPDLSFTGLEEFTNEPVVIKHVVENSEAKASKAKPKAVRKNNGAPIIEDWVSDSEEENASKIEKKTAKPSFVKIDFVKAKQTNKTDRRTTKQVEHNRQNTHIPRGNQRNWNNMMSQRLGSNFEMLNKACYVCGSFDHLQVDYNYQSVVKPVRNNAKRRVNTVKDNNVNIVRPKAVVNAVKASACWVWKPKTKVLDHVSKHNSASITLKKFDYGNPQMDLQDKGVIDSGCSRHMTRNMSYLTDYEEIDGGYVAFRGNPKGGKITGKVPRKNNMYSVDLKNIVPKRGLTCLFAKATSDESKLWHRRLGHLNFKTMNKLVKGNLVRGLPSKLFENDETCVACQKGKQHRASCKSKTENSISLPLHLLHMDLFGPTFVKSLMKKMYCLVVIDDYSRFTWVLFLATKDETSGILKSFINGIENLVDHKVKVIRCDNGTKSKNREMNEFCEKKGILRQYSIARTPQQNGIAERRNRTLIEAARTMLADSKLPTTFWAEAVNTACYVCPVTILNTIDHLGKFDGKADEGFFVGYSLNSKAFRVFNSRTRIVEENLHIRFSENTPNVVGTQSNSIARTKESDNAGQARKETEPVKNYILLPLWPVDPPFSQDPKSSQDDGSKPSSDDEKKVDEDPRKDSESIDQEKDDNVNSTNNVNAARTNEVNAVGRKTSIKLPDDLNMPPLEDYSIFGLSSDDQDDGAEADMNIWIQQSKINLRLPLNVMRLRAITTDGEREKNYQFNGEVQLQALVDGKKIIVTASIVRRDLQLEDAEGVDCLPNATIFEQLTLMGYEKISQKLTFYKAFFSPQWKFLIHTILQCLSSKTTAWNEFSSTMASAIICLATNQKFNFSKYIFESMVKNLDNVSGNFLMYPRFVQVFVNQQLEGMPTHKRIYIAPSHTKKIFGNMRRVGKGFSGRETPLFQTMMVQDQEEVGEGSEMPTDPHHTPTIIQPSTSQPQKKQRSRRSKRKDTEVPQPSGPTTNVADEAVNEEMDDSLERAATTATGLEAEQDSGNIDKTQSKATLNEPSSSGTSSGSGPRRQETMGDTIAQTRSENVSKLSNDPLLARGNTLRSGEDRLKLEELMALCTTLQSRVLALETTKTTQATEIASLKKRVKKLERRNKSRTHGLKRLYRFGSSRRVESYEDKGLGEKDASKQGRIAYIDANEDIYLVNVQTHEDMFGVNDLDGDEVIVESVDDVNTTEETRTLAELKSAKPKATTITTTPTLTTTTAATTIIADSTRPKAKRIVFHKQEQAPTPTVSPQQPSQVKVQDKGKGKMVEPEPMKKMSKKELLRLNEELAFKLQAEEEEEESLAREKAQQVEEANIAWDDIQSKIEVDYQLAQRLQAQEQEELTNEERKSHDCLLQLLEPKKKTFYS